MDDRAALELMAEELALPVEALSPETPFADLGADSLDLVCITMRLEERLNVCISDLEAEACRPVQDALGTV